MKRQPEDDGTTDMHERYDRRLGLPVAKCMFRDMHVRSHAVLIVQ